MAITVEFASEGHLFAGRFRTGAVTIYRGFHIYRPEVFCPLQTRPDILETDGEDDKSSDVEAN